MSIVQIDESGKVLDRAAKVLAGIPGGLEKAMQSAATRSGNTAKTKAGQFAAEEYTISKGTFMSNTDNRSNISVGGGSVTMTLSYAGGVLPLLQFNTKFSKGGYVQTQVKRSGSATILQHAFAANFGSIGIYERLGKSRFPIEGKYGPSTAHMMQNEKVVEQMDETISETFEKRMDHEISRILNGWG